MHLLDPKIYQYRYPQRKRDGKRSSYWLVKCELPDGTTHQSKHPDEADAVRERMRLIREFSGGAISAEQSRDFEVAQRRLDTCQGDARGKSILEAVEYFIANFKDQSNSPLVTVCIADFRKAHLTNKRPHTLEEYDRYLPRLDERFGKFKIGELNRKVLTEYVGADPSPLHHRKCLVSFFGFLSGQSRKLRNPSPCIEDNEARWIPLPAKGPDKEIVILTLDEVKSLLVLAIIHDDLPYWVWCLFTGMRPCETEKFWTREGYGWDRINLDGGYIVVNSEIARDKRRRKIIIRSNLKKWLLMFKEAEELMYPACHRLKFRAIKAEIFPPEKCKILDLLRHTFVSFRAAAFDKSLASTAAESGNSEAIIKAHYLDLITDKAAVDEFWNLTPSSFNLPEVDAVEVSSAEMPNGGVDMQPTFP
jgi:integrase